MEKPDAEKQFLNPASVQKQIIPPDPLVQVPLLADWLRIQGWWKTRIALIEPETDSLLKEWLNLAILGACVGFSERNLNPDLPEHHRILPHIIRDVSGVYRKMKPHSDAKDLRQLKRQVYDFGVQWVYYLDWDLYMSRELY